jgi:acetyl-CoA carboxylase biotin carboxylase subunit
VTELITGIDLVKAQPMIARARSCSSGSDIKLTGHDRTPHQCRGREDFMPSPGPTKLWHAPGGPGIRG